MKIQNPEIERNKEAPAVLARTKRINGIYQNHKRTGLGKAKGQCGNNGR